MAKRKVVIEGNVEYLIHQQGIYQGKLQVMQKFPVSVEIKNAKNSGGEAWDWAQSNWPEFIPEEGPNVLVLVEGNTCEPDELETELRWFCVTGVTDVMGKDLPIEKEKTEWRNTHRTPKGIKNSKNKKTKGQKNYPTDNSSGLKGGIAKPEKQKQPKVASANSLDVDSIKAENIKKAMEKDVN
jgi:hypothetical protein